MPARCVGGLILVGEPGTVPEPGVTVVGSACSGHRDRLLALLRDPSVTVIAVEHRDRCARSGPEYVEAALAAQGLECG